ncbi:MAG: arginine--tRNA ligase [Armatimonadota bacterium]|nr:arginine--tRNA ligase [Armatimonadota bacterium]
MIRQQLQESIREAILRAQQAGDLPPGEVPQVELETPRQAEHGDFASNVALVLARSMSLPPRRVAEAIARHLRLPPEKVERVEIAGPGFLNFFLSPSWLQEVVRVVLEKGERYGRWDVGRGIRVHVEYVSANPTGPLHVGTARNGAIGDCIANLLDALGFEVFREYYLNDYGAQVLALARSVACRYAELFGRSLPFPEDGYRGEYVVEIARKIAERDGPRWLDAPEEERNAYFREFALTEIVGDIRRTLEAFGIRFDGWFSEAGLYARSDFQKTLELLRARGALYEEGGALWFRATAFGDERDRVVIRSDGTPTYLGGDIAYRRSIYERGFQRLINVLGIDHQGQVRSLKAAVQAMGYDPETLEVILYQHVLFRRGGESVRMSRRAGEIVTLQDLLETVGADAARYFLVMTNPSTPLEFDLDLAVKQSSENPVYYVQYAHARICSILREASKHPVGREFVVANPGDPHVHLNEARDLDLSTLTHETERALMRKLADFPDVVFTAGMRREPHRLCAFAQELATAFHVFYTQCRVLTDDPELTGARLALVDATRVVLRKTLQLIGVSAPERM